MATSRRIRFKGRNSIFDKFAGLVTRAAGSSWAFIAAVSIVIIWAVTGPMMDYSETWQLVINTGTTIVTFLMVFLIQQSQNKDSLAIHIKLNELLASHEGSSNRAISVEDLNEDDLRMLRAFYCKLADLARRDEDMKSTHSLDDADAAHARKRHNAARRKATANAGDTQGAAKKHGGKPAAPRKNEIS